MITLDQNDSSDRKQQILAKIDALRSEVSANPKIRLRAQADIFEFLDNAVEDLEKGLSDLLLHQAASKLGMAQKRADTVATLATAWHRLLSDWRARVGSMYDNQV